jgi:hypothetical protein
MRIRIADAVASAIASEKSYVGILGDHLSVSVGYFFPTDLFPLKHEISERQSSRITRDLLLAALASRVVRRLAKAGVC